jgi:Rrf2 family cysteine metabolism transcriptional repressor
MLELAQTYGSGPVPLREIAENQHISAAYLEQLVGPLRRAGLLTSVRGSRGGYLLAREPQDITLGEVVRAVEGSIAPTRCAGEDGQPGACERESSCSARRLWIGVRDSIARELDSTTLADLL